jgi:hypothetical protein
MQADKIWFRRFDGWMVRHSPAARIASGLLFGFGLFVSSLIRNPSLIEASVTGVASALLFATLVYPRCGTRVPNRKRQIVDLAPSWTRISAMELVPLPVTPSPQCAGHCASGEH